VVAGGKSCNEIVVKKHTNVFSKVHHIVLGERILKIVFILVLLLMSFPVGIVSPKAEHNTRNLVRKIIGGIT